MASERARKLRKNMTSGERTLWAKLRRRAIADHRFRRQHPVGPFTVDFVCLEQRLIVEVDGESHERPGARQRDLVRQQWLESQNFTIVRLDQGEVIANTEAALDRIRAVLGLPTEYPQP